MTPVQPNPAEAFQHGTAVEGRGCRTEGSSPVDQGKRGQKRKRRKLSRAMIRQARKRKDVPMENAINSRQNDKDSPEHTDRSRRSKKAKLNHTTVTGPATTSSTPSEKLPSVQNAATASPAPHRNQSYPNIRDKEAWRELAKSTDTAARSQHAETYRRLRKAHKSKESRWGRVVQRELEDLGLVDSVVRDGAKTPPKSGDKGVNGVKDDAAVVYKIVEEDEFDIDIYGDEETRRKYEPWIKSLEAEK